MPFATGHTTGYSHQAISFLILNFKQFFGSFHTGSEQKYLYTWYKAPVETLWWSNSLAARNFTDFNNFPLLHRFLLTEYTFLCLSVASCDLFSTDITAGSTLPYPLRQFVVCLSQLGLIVPRVRKNASLWCAHTKDPLNYTTILCCLPHTRIISDAISRALLLTHKDGFKISQL